MLKSEHSSQKATHVFWGGYDSYVKLSDGIWVFSANSCCFLGCEMDCRDRVMAANKIECEWVT